MIWLKNLLFISMAVFSVNSSAQETQDNSEEVKQEETVQKSPKKFEKVEVTGSRIRRTDFEGPTPVMVIDRSTLDNTSYNSISDVLRDMPISNFGAARETTGTTTGGSARVSLRGQGSTNTLVMINGTRLQRDGRSGSADLNLIPEIAIESSDILLDGASAIYGADAIGGVLHIKTRKDFTGVEASVKYVLPEDNVGTRMDLGVIGGQQWEKVSVTGAFQYRLNDELRGSARSWLRPEVGSPTAPTPAYFSDNGTADGADDFWAMRPEDIDACNADGDSRYSFEDPNQVCRYNWFNIATELPKIQQYSAYANAVWTPNSRTTVDTSLLFTNQATSSRFAPVPFEMNVDPTAAAGWGVALPNLATNADGDAEFRHRFLSAGNREFEFESQAYNITSTVTREFGETWQAQAILGYGSSDTHSETARGAMLASEFITIANSGNYNPYNPSAAALAPAFYVPFQDTLANELFVELSANGELFELVNGLPVSAAFGVQVGHSYYSDTSDDRSANGEVIGGASSGGTGHRDTAAMFLELNIPFSTKVEMQAAIRADSYSDFGAAVSPMVAVKYAPNKSLLFRASGGKAFKAPLLQSVYASGSNGFPTFIDQVKCEENRAEANFYCNPQQYQVTQEVGAQLDPEEAININLGAVYAPNSNFSVSADFWQIDQSQAIGVSLEQITFAELRDPSGATLAENGITVNRRSNGEIDNITTPLQNLGGSLTRGANVSLSYRLDTDFGAFRFADAHSHIFTLDSEPFPGVGAISFIDDAPKWRNTVSVSYLPTRLHSFTISYMMIPEYNNGNRFDKIPFYGEMDLSYGTQFAWGGTLNVGIKNILGSAPPVDDFVGFNGGLYNPLGRYAFLNYRHSF